MTSALIRERVKHKKSYFIHFEIELKYWNESEYCEECDYFDLEDMLISRYWLKIFEREGYLTKEEITKLHELDKQFYKKKIHKFVKKHYPYIYKKWIGKLEEKNENET